MIYLALSVYLGDMRTHDFDLSALQTEIYKSVDLII